MRNPKFRADDKVWFISSSLSKCNSSGCHHPDHRTKPEVTSGEIFAVHIIQNNNRTEIRYEIFLEGYFDENEVFKTKKECERFFQNKKKV